MKQIKLMVRVLVLFVFLGVSGFFLIKYYSWIFAKTVHGKIMDVQRVTNPTAILGAKLTDAQIHSYSVLIQGDDGVLYTASSEDRQWQVASKGYCVRALLYRYPPWDLEKAGTFFNARIKELKLCDGSAPVPGHSPTSNSPNNPVEPQAPTQ